MRLSLAAVAVWLLVSCGTAPSGSTSALAPNTVAGLVQYSGALQGTLQVAAFRSSPPVGSPAASVRVEITEFPARYELSGLPAGRYFVLALLDIDPTDGERFHPTKDPGGAVGSFFSPVPTSLGDTAGVDGVDLELVDPSGDSIWATGGYR